MKLSFIIHPTRFQMDANDDKHPQISDTPHMHIGCAWHECRTQQHGHHYFRFLNIIIYVERMKNRNQNGSAMQFLFVMIRGKFYQIDLKKQKNVFIIYIKTEKILLVFRMDLFDYWRQSSEGHYINCLKNAGIFHL